MPCCSDHTLPYLQSNPYKHPQHIPIYSNIFPTISYPKKHKNLKASIRKRLKSWTLIVVFLQKRSGLQQRCQELLVFLRPIFHSYPSHPISPALCLEGENVLPCRDQGLAGAYCGRHHRPDVHMHRRRRRRRIQGILVHPGSQPGWSCQSSKAQ